METERLYWKDPYLKEFDATVVRVLPEIGAFSLDKTLFFPEGGGQVSDLGTVNGVPLAHVSKNRDDEKEILHFVGPEAIGKFSAGQQVRGVLDWEKRYRTMRLHSAAHIVFFLFRRFDVACLASSGKVDWEKDRGDYDFSEGKELTPEVLEQITVEANRVASLGLPIKVWFEESSGHEYNPWTGDKTDTPAGLRKKWQLQIPKDDPSLAGLDEIMECGGTHVRNTSEIGKVRVAKGKAPGRGLKRVEIFLQD